MANKKVSFSYEELPIKEIENYYSSSGKALRSFYQNNNHFFIGYTLAELADELDKYINELDKSCALTILAAIEAHLRINYLQRCYNKEKDALSREFRKLYKIKGPNASLSDDLLDVWAKSIPNKSLISVLRSALKYRHWLAHGRWRVAKLGRNYDFTDLLTLAINLQKVLGIQMGA